MGWARQGMATDGWLAVLKLVLLQRPCCALHLYACGDAPAGCRSCSCMVARQCVLSHANRRSAARLARRWPDRLHNLHVLCCCTSAAARWARCSASQPLHLHVPQLATRSRSPAASRRGAGRWQLLQVFLPEHAHTVFSFIHCSYSLGAVLGAGSFGVVRECTDRRTGRRFAVKSINKVGGC